MAALHATNQRQQHFITMSLQYPLWLFDVDDPRWPRRLDSLPPESYPAKITGWIASTSEYDMFLDRPQDLMHAQRRGMRIHSAIHTAGLVQQVLQQLRYDDRYSLSSLQAVVQNGEGQVTVGLESWIFDQNGPGWVGLSTVLRIERTWDQVTIWDPKVGLERLSDFEAMKTYYGVAILIADDAALLDATGMSKMNSGDAIRKAEFERLNGSGSVVQGIVCPSRWRGPGDHGLALNRGSQHASNRRLIAGTALQGADWKTVVEYRKWLRRSPLL